MTGIYLCSPDGRYGRFPNNFSWRTIDYGNKVEILDPNLEIIYLGTLHLRNNDYETAYIKLTNYSSNKPNSSRVVLIKEMESISADLIEFEDKMIKISSQPVGSIVQIVIIPPFMNIDFDTDSVLIEKVVNANPFYIGLSGIEEVNESSFVIWIGNKCQRIKN